MNLEELKSLYDFTDRTVLVTGGAGVLGGEIACALIGCNANIVLLDRDQELAQKVIERFPKVVKGRGVRVYGDVLTVETLHQANETIQAEFGAVDILINAAGGNHPSATTSANLTFFDLPLDALRHVGDLNLLGTILPCQVFGRGMAERGEGVILNVSSMNAFRPLTRIPRIRRQRRRSTISRSGWPFTWRTIIHRASASTRSRPGFSLRNRTDSCSRIRTPAS
jgi:NAD(P)-dependent dehydrogenase (short-subunit alcohol dehydrogenase family)